MMWQGILLMRVISNCVSLVHGMGMQTRAGTWVWVTQVWVRVQHEVLVQNPYPCDGFDRYFRGTIILSTITVQLTPPNISLDVDYHHIVYWVSLFPLLLAQQPLQLTNSCSSTP